MPKLAYVLENVTYKFLWEFDIQTDHLISVKPYNNQQKKKKQRELPK